jgi:uncharacterized repeat protein (TIGR03803 family)
MSRLDACKTIIQVGALCMSAAAAAPAQTFTNLFSFDGTDGSNPEAALVQGFDGNYYGTTFSGGAHTGCGDSVGCGTVFRVTSGGKLNTIYSFCTQPNCTDGYGPVGGLALATNGNFYGTTQYGGTSGDGTVFEITPSGKLTSISLSGANGSQPYAAPVQATNGNLYGTTSAGGNNGDGTVYELSPSGKITTLYTFCSQTGCTDGAVPLDQLVQGTDGNFYGTTVYGGANDACGGFDGFPGCGTVFKLTPEGKLTVLHSFCAQSGCADGEIPTAGLVQGTDGNFYGTTQTGTPTIPNYGTAFKISPTGSLTTLYHFCSKSDCTDGRDIYAGLIQATDGNLYGTSAYGGVNDFCIASDGATGCGTIFRLTTARKLTTLYSFCSETNCADGDIPFAAPVQATNGIFYGTTSGEANGGNGTVFSLSVGLGPFVETVPTSGKIGGAVTILGNNLTGSTSVTFNGTATSFTVSKSGTYITTTVPSGAATGYVTVTTASGITLTSNVEFRVP